MMPIPLRALPSVAYVRIPVETDEGYNDFADARRIDGVRYESADGLRARGYQLQDGTTGVLYVDAVNSRGAFEVPAGSLVRIDNATSECCVNVSKPMAGLGGRIHHWEIELR